MGFGFNLLFIFVLLPLSVIIFMIMLYYRKWKLVVVIIGSIICIGIIMSGVGELNRYLNSKIDLTRDKIIGKYEIDTLLYPGKNSRWQFKTYSFEITNKDSILFRIKNEHVDTLIKGKLRYNYGLSALFEITTDTPTYHVLKFNPTLHRGHHKFYYSFATKYNTMFFKKR